VDIGTDI